MPSVPTDELLRQTNLHDESSGYAQKREELRQAELELSIHHERVAMMRRALPPGPLVEDYVFLEGPGVLAAGDDPIRTVRLSELFTGRGRALIVYQMMYGKRQKEPCPMCTSFVDAWNGIACHVAQKADLAVVAAADPPALRSHARRRGWTNLRFLSCGNNTFKFDLGSEDHAGNQDSTVSVFTLDPGDMPRHFYSAHPRLARDTDSRGLDLLNPIWNFFDLTPAGRGDFLAKLEYPPRNVAASGWA